MNVDLDSLRSRLTDAALSITEFPDGSGAILDIDGRQVLTLNETAMAIVGEIAAHDVTKADLLAAVCERFDATADQAEHDLETFLTQLSGLLGQGEPHT